MVKEEKDPIEKRLDAIIGLLSESLLTQETISQKSVFQALNRAGLTPTEIGSIFGKGRGEVGSVLIRAKQSKSKKSNLQGKKDD